MVQADLHLISNPAHIFTWCSVGHSAWDFANGIILMASPTATVTFNWRLMDVKIFLSLKELTKFIKFHRATLKSVKGLNLVKLFYDQIRK
jgi:hypothetical protein